MKSLYALVAGIALLAILAGCAGAPISLPTAQQQFAQGCTVVNGELTVLSTSPLLSADQQTQVKTILSKNQSICAAGAQLSVADLKDFHDSLLPAAITIVEAFPSLPNQPAILFGLQAFGPIVQGLIDQLITATSAASATAAASAPAAVSVSAFAPVQLDVSPLK